MPTTAGGLIFYEEQFETGLWQGFTQFTDAFNDASANALILGDGARKGRRPKEAYLDEIQGLIQRRDPSGNGNLTVASFGDHEQASIKIFRSAPLKLTRQDWIDKGLATETGTRIFGEQFGRGQARDYLNTALAGLVGAIGSIGASAVLDVTATSTMDFPTLNLGLGKFGDARQAIRAMVSYSKVLTDLLGQGLTSQTIAFQVGQTTIYNGAIPAMGLKEIVSDAPPLFVDNTDPTPDNYYTLLLVPQAVKVSTGPSNQVFAFVTGDGNTTPENHKYLLTIEYEYEIKVKGVSYTGAADNPTNAQLATAANWTMVATDRKLGPGVLIKSK